jgi:hypothetical protein
VDIVQTARLRASGASWLTIARQLGMSVGALYQAGKKLSKISQKNQSESD